MKATLSSFAGEIDRALRGQYTTRESLQDGKIRVSVARLTQATLVLGLLYGMCMGLFPLLRDAESGALQMLATMLKVPLLFLLTLVVTFPSLYVFSALCGSRLDAMATLRLLIIAIAINLAVLAGFGPVTAFFVLCTQNYPFIKVLNVLLFGIAGIISLVFLKRTLSNVFADQKAERDARSRKVFGIWLLVYGVVGAQMSWVMRPFIGNPDLPFELFRARQSNFFHDVLKSLGALFS